MLSGGQAGKGAARTELLRVLLGLLGAWPGGPAVAGGGRVPHACEDWLQPVRAEGFRVMALV